MRWAFAIALMVLGAGLMASPLNQLLPVRLDPLLIMAIAWGIGRGPREGAVFGALAGLVEDLTVGGGGHAALAKLAVGMAAGYMKPMVYYRLAYWVIPIAALATLASETLLALSYGLRLHAHVFTHLAHLAGPEALGNAIIAWPLYELVRWGLRRTQDRYATRAQGIRT
jgi:rod shape-determining protein MreD